MRTVASLVSALMFALSPTIAYASGAGNCLDWDGTGDYADGTGVSTSLTAITLEAWVYHRTLPASVERYVTVGSEVAVLRHNGSTQQGQLHFYIKTGGSLHAISVNGALQTNRWYHVAGTWDGTDMKLYLNGEEVGTSAPGGSLDAPAGTVLLSHVNSTMDGYMEEVRIWNDARTPDEIRSNMYTTLTGSETGLENYWKLDEDSGSTAYDAAGSVDLTLYNMTNDDWVTSGAFAGPRNALDFDGGNDYVNVGNDASFDVGNTLTIEAWVKPSDLSSRDGVFSTRFTNDAGSFQLEIGTGNGGTGRVAVTSPSTWVAQTDDNAIALNEWTHIAYTRSGTGSGTHTIYVNGVEQTLISDADYTFYDNLSDKVIGSGTSGGNILSGQLDEVRIWNVALSAAEIREQMCKTLVGDESNLVGYWRFDQEAGDRLYDWSLNSNHGTLITMTDEDWVACDVFTTWIGCAGTDWATAANWSLGEAPNADSTNVGIPTYSGGNQPTMAGDYTCNHLSITSGATCTINSGWTLTLNGNAYSLGSTAGDGEVELTGASATHAIAGTFENVELNEAAGAKLVGDAVINGTLTLTNGDLNLNGHTLTLGAAAILSETDGNTVLGDSGTVTTTRTFNAGDLSGGANIADLGVEIATDAGLGQTTISRGHAAQTADGLSSILRYFDITPTNNSGLDATLVFHYDDSELNGLTESYLGLGRSTDSGSTWSTEGGAVDTGNETITLGGIDAFSRWTAFELGFHHAVTLDDVSNGSMAWGDYDSDGDLDVLLAGATAGSSHLARVYRNSGGGFSNAVSFTGMWQSSVAWGDYDSDGDLDILMAGDIGISNGITRIYRNNGSGTFTNISAGLPGTYYSSVAWGDYDNDGDLDVLMAGYTGSTNITGVYRNDGSDTFTDIGAGLPGVQSCSVAWGDYDNDGDLDVLMAGSSSAGRITRIYENVGGTFSDYVSLTGVFGCSVAWGDYDNDGDLDVLLAGHMGTGRITHIYRNDGSSTFTDIGAGLPGVEECSVAWGDYDNDGDLDVLLAGYTGSARIARIYRNEGSDTFTDVGAGLTGVENCSVAWGDYDNDGDLDVFLAGYTGSGRITRIYRNDGLTTNSIPDTPSNLTASGSGQEVALSWDTSTDAETATDGLTYNLRMGTSPGGVEIVPPMADVGTGWRRVPALGNTNHDTTWTIQSLSPGWCYWSVQAIDNAFAGSAFALIDSFYCLGADMMLTGTVQLDTLVLEWTTVPPASSYWVYGTFNDAFFDPQVQSPFGYRQAVTTDTTWSNPAGIDDPDTNWTYQVIAVDGANTELGRTNRFGEHEFLMP